LADGTEQVTLPLATSLTVLGPPADSARSFSEQQLTNGR